MLGETDDSSQTSGILRAEVGGRADVAVVGGGVVGLACASELAKRGASVVVLEANRIGHGCSYGNAGWLTPSLALPLAVPGVITKGLVWLLDPDSPFYIQPRLDPSLLPWLLRFAWATRRSRFERSTAALVAMCKQSVDLWEALALSGGDDFGFERRGLVNVYENTKALEAALPTAGLLARNGVRFERWTAEEVREREPIVRGRQVGAIFYPDDAHCEPYRAVCALAEEAKRHGVRVLEGAEVFGVERQGRNGKGQISALATAQGRIVAERFVLAAGTTSRELGKLFGVRVPLLGAKGYSVLVPRATIHPRRSLYLAERKVAINPHAQSLRIAGTLELVKNDLSINSRRLGSVLRGAQEMLDLPKELEIQEVWRGLRPTAPDGMPMIGAANSRTRGGSNLWVATAHQMTGLKAALGTALLLAQLMAGEDPSFDPEPFRVDRF